MIALYARVSTQEQAREGYSIEEQADRLKKYCEAIGQQDYSLYIDPGFSGASMDRPELRRLIADVKRGIISKVIVYKLDRLSRSQKDTLYIIEDVILANGADFESITERFDTGTPFGRAMIGILSVFAQLEREQITERMKMGKEGRAKTGRWSGGSQAPIGYDYKDGHLVVNEYEAMQIKEAYELYIGGHSIKDITRQFEAKGYAHKYGPFGVWSVARVLKNPIYTGRLSFKGEIYQGEHDAIIDDETFEKAQKRHEAQPKNSHTFKNRSYLAGLVYCRRCGAKYAALFLKDKGFKQYDYYKCYSRTQSNPHMIKDPNCKNKTWRLQTLDEIILGEIKKLSLDRKLIEDMARPVKDHEQEKRQKAIEKEIKKLEAQRLRLLDIYTTGRFSVEDLETKVEEIDGRLIALRQQANENEKRPALAAQDAVKIVRDFSDILDRGIYEEIRLVIESLIYRIEIDGDDVFIFWRFIPESASLADATD